MPMHFHASYLPQLRAAADSTPRTQSSTTILVADLQAAELAAERAAAVAAMQHLRQRPIATILTSLSRVVDAWLAADSPDLDAAAQVLPDLTGFSEAVVRRGLRAHFEALAGDAIGTLLDRELGDRQRLDADLRPCVPESITHYLAGNLPGLGIAPTLLSLAVGAVPLVKCAAGDPFLPAALARRIAAIDPDLGRCLVVHDWRGGDGAFDHFALAAPLTLAMGSDTTLASLAKRAEGRFIGHGHKLSFAVVTHDAIATAPSTERIARALALDVALWDQYGCLSPQLCFVAGEARDFEAFAEALAAALTAVAQELPPRRLGLEERAAIGRFRRECEWAPTSPDDRLVVPKDSTAWGLSLEHSPLFRPTCLNRCLRLVRLDDLDALPGVLTPHRAQLECAGIASGDTPGVQLTEALRSAGVHRVCAIGTMQSPGLEWCQSGRPRVADWLQFEKTA